MVSRILQGDVFDMLPTIARGSVDCVVTSPPYWMLRSYLSKGHPLKHRELGSERTPDEFVARMVEVFRLVRDCMADHATCWVNIGDSYANNPSNQQGAKSSLTSNGGAGGCPITGRTTREPGIDSGNLCLIPQRLALALQADGWLVRSVVIWHKSAPMPASVAGWRWMKCRVKEASQKKHGSRKNAEEVSNARVGLARFSGGVEDKSLATKWSDCPGCPKCEPNGGLVLRRGSWRPTSSYEPVLMLAKKSGYFCDGESVKTAPKSATTSRDQYTRILDDPDEEFAVRHDHETNAAGGANLRDVWTIAAELLKEKHYAAFPTELVRRCLKAGTSERGYCPVCGSPWARVVETERRYDHTTTANGKSADGPYAGQIQQGEHDIRHGVFSDVTTTGWRPTCQCSPEQEPRPALVLDPFAGSGRTGVTAQRMFLDFVGVELNPEYSGMAERILRDDCPLFSDVG